MRKLWVTLAVVTTAVVTGSMVAGHRAMASDHDDGTSDLKTQNTNLTDLYVFTEKTADTGGSATNLVAVLNCNPRSLPRTQYYFSTKANYKVHFSRVGVNNTAANGQNSAVDDKAPTGSDDFFLTYAFGSPDASNKQSLTVTATRDGAALATKTKDDNANAMTTTPLTTTPAAANGIWTTTIDGSAMTIFAGTREDPFFFDVEQFFRVRAGIASSLRATTPSDFTAGYNVLSIVTKLPIALIAGTGAGAGTNVFDAWETIEVLN